ncbi:MAG: hypothetical protein HC778_05235 [Chamaesiphon sp. CSU_1_12]|nr:hypothetical protein [Chamaesiphon sp. CSU_1_12]
MCRRIELLRGRRTFGDKNVLQVLSEIRMIDAATFAAAVDEHDEAQAEVDKWIRENQEFAAQGAGVPNTELNRRILKRFDVVRKAYEDFIAGAEYLIKNKVRKTTLLNWMGNMAYSLNGDNAACGKSNKCCIAVIPFLPKIRAAW